MNEKSNICSQFKRYFLGKAFLSKAESLNSYNTVTLLYFPHIIA